MQKDEKNKWETISSKAVYKNPWFYVKKEKVKYPDGHTGFYYVLKRYGPFVVIVAQKKNKTLLIEQHRQAVKKNLWEFPMGAVEEKEDLIEAARREFLEESGHRALSLEKIGQFYVGPGLTDQRGTVFLAKKVKKADIRPEGESGEFIKNCEWIGFDKLEEKIIDGKIEDGPTITAFFMVKSYLKRQK